MYNDHSIKYNVVRIRDARGEEPEYFAVIEKGAFDSPRLIFESGNEAECWAYYLQIRKAYKVLSVKRERSQIMAESEDKLRILLKDQEEGGE